MPERSAASPMRRATALLVAVMSIAGFALTLLVFFPGYMTNDAVFVYGYSKDWSFGDWQSPLMSMLWWLIDPIAPGPASIFLLIAALYWLGFWLLGRTVAQRSAWLGLAAPLLALMPPAFMFLGMIWRDVLFAAVWLVAAALVYAFAQHGPGPRRTVQALALMLIGFGVLLRPNAVVAAPVIAAHAIWPPRFDWKRVAILFVPALVTAYALVHVVYYGILGVKQEHPLHALLVFDLGGITHMVGENQFPVSWSADQTALLTSRCYNPDRWDSYWTFEPCRFVMQRLEARDDVIFGTPRLIEAWMRAVLKHPLAYLRHRLTYMWTLLAGPTLTLELYNVDDPGRTPLAQNPYFRTALAVHDVLKATFLFRLGFWLMAAVAICLLAWPRRATSSGAFALGATVSGILYVLTYLPLGVAADFRYGYWCVLASLVGGVAAAASRGDRFAAA